MNKEVNNFNVIANNELIKGISKGDQDIGRYRNKNIVFSIKKKNT